MAAVKAMGASGCSATLATGSGYLLSWKGGWSSGRDGEGEICGGAVNSGRGEDDI